MGEGNRWDREKGLKSDDRSRRGAHTHLKGTFGVWSLKSTARHQMVMWNRRTVEQVGRVDVLGGPGSWIHVCCASWNESSRTDLFLFTLTTASNFTLLLVTYPFNSRNGDTANYSMPFIKFTVPPHPEVQDHQLLDNSGVFHTRIVYLVIHPIRTLKSFRTIHSDESWQRSKLRNIGTNVSWLSSHHTPDEETEQWVEKVSISEE